MADPADLGNRFTYHPPKDGQPEIYQAIRDGGLTFATLISEAAPDSREKDQALARIEEAVMWANAAVARHG